MYEIYVNHQDGNGDQFLWSDNAAINYQIISPTMKEAIDEVPSFDFTILPSHPEYNKITKFKTTVKVLRNNSVMFYGRVMADGKDMYGQKSIACEGALSFLLDSVQMPVSKTTETPLASFTRIVENHNALMPQATDGFKHFTVGQVTIDNANTAKSYQFDNCGDTMSAINALREDYHGYLRARLENGTLYIDWLKDYNRSNAQPIKMAVNLLDISTEETIDEYYTVMFPIGIKNKTIESENNGSKFLTDTAAVAKYGTIIHPEDFDDKTAAGVKEKALKKFNHRSTDIPRSVTFTAVDMKLVGHSVDELKLGDVLTDVEGYSNESDWLTLVEISRDLFDPSKDQYTAENKAAIDKRNESEGGKGTASSRMSAARDALDTMRDEYRRNFKVFELTVSDTFSVTSQNLDLLAQNMKINANKLKVIADEFDWESEAYGEDQIRELRAYFQSYRRGTPKQIVDVVQEVTGFTINGETFKAEYRNKTDENGNVIYKYKADANGNIVYALDEDTSSPTYGQQIPVYDKDDQGNLIPEKELVTPDTDQPTTVRSMQKRTAKMIEQTVGTMGIQLDPVTLKPFTDSQGNYIYVETNPDGTAKKNGDGTYKIIDFPDGTVTSRIKQTEGNITAEVQNRMNADTLLRGAIEVNANKVGMIVTAKSGGGYELNRAAIIAAINEDGTSTATISADKIDLQGYVTATDLSADAADFMDVYVGDLHSDGTVHFEEMVGSGTSTIEAASLTALASIYLGETDISNALYDVQIIGPTNNVYTLQAQTIANAGTQTWNNVGTFSRAVSSFTPTWDGSTYKVTANPQNKTYSQAFDLILTGQPPASSFSAIFGEAASGGQGAIATTRISKNGYLHEFTDSGTKYVGVFTMYNSSNQTYSGEIARIQVTGSKGTVTAITSTSIDAGVTKATGIMLDVAGTNINDFAGDNTFELSVGTFTVNDVETPCTVLKHGSDIIGRVNCRSIFNDGQNDGRTRGWFTARNDNVEFPDALSTSSTIKSAFSFGYPGQTYNTMDTYDCTLATDSSYAYVTGGNQTIARINLPSTGVDLSHAGDKISIGGASDPDNTDKSGKKITGKIWYDDNGTWKVMKNADNTDRTFEIGVNANTPSIYNPQQGYIQARVTINGTLYYSNAIKLTSSQISAWGGPIS